MTSSVVGFIPVFKIDKCANIILDSLKYYIDKYQSQLIAHVIMPDHMHCIVALREDAAISGLMRDFKKFTSVAIKKFLNKNDEYDLIKRELQKHVPPDSNRSFKLWKDRFDDVAIYSDEVLLTKMNYMRNNPVKAGLVEHPEDYPYSSFYEPEHRKRCQK